MHWKGVRFVDDKESNNLEEYWATRVLQAEGATGYVGEVYNQLAMTFEITDPTLEPIEGAWLHTKVYRTMTVYATTDAAHGAAERLRRFLNFVHLRE
jgi:hypothetical protein